MLVTPMHLRFLPAALLWTGLLAAGTVAAQSASDETATRTDGPAATADTDLPLTPELARIFAGGEPTTVEQLAAMESYVQALFKKVLPSTVNIGGATGVIVPGGYVLTAGHVIIARQGNRPRGGNIRVTLDDGRRLQTRPLGLSHTTDTGLLEILTKGDFPHLEMGRSKDLRPGQWCVMLGFPGGPKPGLKPPLRLGRVLRVPARGYLVTDCTMSAGDSGGPLFDMQGRVIGINSRISRDLRNNMHTPIDAFRDEWERLVAGEVMGRARRPVAQRTPRGKPAVPGWLGAIADPKADTARIVAVAGGSPAARAGVQPGDVILRIDNRRIFSPRTMQRRLARLSPGQRIAIQLRRGDRQHTLQVVLAEPPRPAPKPDPKATPKPLRRVIR